MLDATTEASNRNAQDLALTKYKDHMCYVLNGTGNGSRVPFLKTITLQCHHDQALSGALLEFQSIATMGLEGSLRAARVVLCERIEAERVRYFEINDMRNPFKDLEMYAVPVIVASVGWMMATFTDVTCSHDICEVAETSFRNVVSGRLLYNPRNMRDIPLLFMLPLFSSYFSIYFSLLDCCVWRYGIHSRIS